MAMDFVFGLEVYVLWPLLWILLYDPYKVVLTIK